MGQFSLFIWLLLPYEVVAPSTQLFFKFLKGILIF